MEGKYFFVFNFYNDLCVPLHLDGNHYTLMDFGQKAMQEAVKVRPSPSPLLLLIFPLHLSRSTANILAFLGLFHFKDKLRIKNVYKR